MDQVDQLKGWKDPDLTRDSTEVSRGASRLCQMGCEMKKAAVHAEMARVNELPSNSLYAVHRMRVLNKLLHLLSIQRTVSQDEELELLFAGLSL